MLDIEYPNHKEKGEEKKREGKKKRTITANKRDSQEEAYRWTRREKDGARVEHGCWREKGEKKRVAGI